jgi:hypothetical protein
LKEKFRRYQKFICYPPRVVCVTKLIGEKEMEGKNLKMEISPPAVVLKIIVLNN